MSSGKVYRSLADYVVVAIIPALIMALVGSLVFFLLEVLYVGQYQDRLRWILFWFVFAAVLIARMSMIGELAERAAGYGLVLAGAVFLSVLRFVEYPPNGPWAGFEWLINLCLMAITWWCAHRLTWDCTLEDDSLDVSGQGLLEASGFEESSGITNEDVTEDEPVKTKKKKASGLAAWWVKYQNYKERQKRKPHTPGIWVVYFSLAALPLFGLGQSLMPEGGAEALERRRYTFWLMGIYVASGLGLLLTTSFLALRHYLRKRNLQMPSAMTAVWLTMGAVLTVVLLLVGALLPRPHAEYSWGPLARLNSPTRLGSSFWSYLTSGHGQGTSSRGSTDETKPGQDGQDGNGTQSDPKDGGERPPQSKGEKPPGEVQSGQSGGDGNQGQQGNQKPGGKSPGEENPPKPGGARPPPKPAPPKLAPSPRPSAGTAPSTSSLSKLATVAKWVIFGLAAIFMLVLGLRSLLRFLANFTEWAKNLLALFQNWWQGIFGLLRPAAAVDQTAAEEEAFEALPPSFATFSNPFRNGEAERVSPEELVRYSFAALEALAYERGSGRHAGETPLEFVQRAAMEIPSLEADTQRLGNLYVQAAYARGSLNPRVLSSLQQFWKRLEVAAEQPLSA